jgi:uncharacterized pyridoxamine 5'-phosphate oxidase family protein
MVDYVSILEKNPNGVLATQDGKRVKTRVFRYMCADGNKVYFMTSNNKPVFAQLKDNSHVSFCTFPPDYAPVLIIEGKAVFDENKATKELVFAKHPSAKEIYRTPVNPIFKVFHIDVDRVQTFSETDGERSYKVNAA